MANNKYDLIVVRDYYPSENNPSWSLFVHHQVIGSKERGFSPVVISPTPYMPAFIRKKNHYPPSHNNILSYEGIDVVRPPYLKLPINFLQTLSHKNLSKVILRSSNGHNPSFNRSFRISSLSTRNLSPSADKSV